MLSRRQFLAPLASVRRCASSVPRLGPYNSADAAVVAARARWMLEAGVGAINLSWWGRGSFEDLRVPIVNGRHARSRSEGYVPPRALQSGASTARETFRR